MGSELAVRASRPICCCKEDAMVSQGVFESGCRALEVEWRREARVSCRICELRLRCAGAVGDLWSCLRLLGDELCTSSGW